MARIMEIPGRVPPTIAQQVFTIGSAIAGGVGGIVLARNLTKVRDVPVDYVAATTMVSVIFTFGAAMALARMATKEY